MDQATPLAEMTAAADGGDAESAHRLALMHGCGLGAPLDWNAAFARLRQAADGGHEVARGSLEILGATPDIDSLLAGPAPTVLSRRPHVLSIAGFLSPEACDWLIARARPRLGRAAVYDNVSAGPVVQDIRDNSTAPFEFFELDLVLLLVRERIARATGLPVPGLEPVQILHYAVGQRFEPHFDWLDPARPGHRPDLARSGQRVATFLIYLNDGYEGGETEMPSIGLKHRGAVGDALFWANVTPDGKPDPSTLHAGRAPTLGEKWVLSQWCRNRAPRRDPPDAPRSASA